MTTRQKSILAGALITGILSTSYFNFVNTICCLGVMLGGAAAVQQYTSQSGTAVESGDGAIMGALAGAAGAVFASIFEAILRPVGLDSQTISQNMMDEWMRGMEGMEGQPGMSPEMMEQMQSGDMGIVFILLGTAVTMVIYAIFGAIGGAIGTSLFGPDEG